MVQSTIFNLSQDFPDANVAGWTYCKNIPLQLSMFQESITSPQMCSVGVPITVLASASTVGAWLTATSRRESNRATSKINLQWICSRLCRLLKRSWTPHYSADAQLQVLEWRFPLGCNKSSQTLYSSHWFSPKNIWQPFPRFKSSRGRQNLHRLREARLLAEDVWLCSQTNFEFWRLSA